MNEEVKKRFLQDPQWYLVEQMILDFINPLLDITTVDITQSSEHVKAEILARKMSYDALINFTRSSGLTNEKITREIKNIFK